MMTMNSKRGSGYDCERQNNKTLMQSFVDILYVFWYLFSKWLKFIYLQARELQISPEICEQVGNMIQCEIK